MILTTLISLLPIASSMAIEKRAVDGQVNSGDGTYYDTGLGACGWTNSNDQLVAAIPTGQWDNGAHCGQQVSITANGVTEIATIVDRCMGCKDGDLDMTPTLFDKFYPQARGRAPVTWRFISDGPTTTTTTGSPTQDPTTAAAATTAAPTTEAVQTTTDAPATTASSSSSSSSAAAVPTTSILPIEGGSNSTNISVPIGAGNFTNLELVNAALVNLGNMVIMTVVFANQTAGANVSAVQAMFEQGAPIAA